MKRFSNRIFYSLRFLVAILDFFLLQIALLIGYWLWMTFPWHGNYQLFSDFSMILWVLPPIGIIVFKAVGLYKPEMGVLGVQEQSLIFKATWITYFTVLAISFFYRQVEFSRLAVFYSIFLALTLVSTERFLMRRLFEWLNQNGIVVRRAIIYGAGYHGQRLERWIRHSPQLGIRVIGYLDDDLQKLVKRPENTPVLGQLDDLKKLAKGKDASLLFIAHRNLDEAKVVEIFQLCQNLELQCWAIPSLYRFHVERAALENIGGIPLVGFRTGFAMRSYMAIKRFLDIVLAAIALVAVLPLGLFIALGVLANSGPPIFFTQTRVGEGGKKFLMYKFRTLNSGTRKDEISPELQKTEKVLNPFCAVLRRTGLDELPQLINVLKAEMSIVGPRPEMPFIADKYGPLEKERLTVKPGITGLWQISKDRKRFFIHENMDYDLYYVEHLSFNLDLAILVKTVWTVLSRIFEQGSKGERAKS